jgi:hypothetical protein
MRMFDYHYIHPGFIFIPCPNTTPGGLWAQYLIPKLMPKCECLSIHSSLPSVRATSPCDPANPAQTVLLPNENTLPTAGIFAESSEEIFPCRMEFVTKFGPQICLLPGPIFGVNTYVCRSWRSERWGVPWAGVVSWVPRVGARGPIPRAGTPGRLWGRQVQLHPLMHIFILCFETQPINLIYKLHCFTTEIWLDRQPLIVMTIPWLPIIISKYDVLYLDDS